MVPFSLLQVRLISPKDHWKHIIEFKKEKRKDNHLLMEECYYLPTGSISLLGKESMWKIRMLLWSLGLHFSMDTCYPALLCFMCGLQVVMHGFYEACNVEKNMVGYLIVIHVSRIIQLNLVSHFQSSCCKVQSSGHYGLPAIYARCSMCVDHQNSWKFFVGFVL